MRRLGLQKAGEKPEVHPAIFCFHHENFSHRIYFIEYLSSAWRGSGMILTASLPQVACKNFCCFWSFLTFSSLSKLTSSLSWQSQKRAGQAPTLPKPCLLYSSPRITIFPMVLPHYPSIILLGDSNLTKLQAYGFWVDITKDLGVIVRNAPSPHIVLLLGSLSSITMPTNTVSVFALGQLHKCTLFSNEMWKFMGTPATQQNAGELRRWGRAKLPLCQSHVCCIRHLESITILPIAHLINPLWCSWWTPIWSNDRYTFPLHSLVSRWPDSWEHLHKSWTASFVWCHYPYMNTPIWWNGQLT